ncbi:MAG: hypothetical protein Q9163_000454 [Psora crenata]
MLTSISLAAALATLSSFATAVNAATAAEWRTRSVYQLLTDRFARTDGSTTASCPDGFSGYCGGTWRGIIDHLDYIQGMGFDAVWISPITKQVDDESRAWHGYSQQDLYSLNSRFGTPTDLKDLSEALHKRGMYLMVDVVTNHFGYDMDASATIDYTKMNPFNSRDYFHDFCQITNQDNLIELTTCDVGGNSNYPLPDVVTTLPSVRKEFNTWIAQLVDSYNIDGLRIDSVKNVEMEFWPGFQDAAGVYIVGEVAEGRVEVACPYQEALDGILNYPLYFQLTYFFNGQIPNSKDLINLMTMMNSTSAGGCKDPTLMAPFSENHDNPRFGNYKSDKALAANVAAFVILADGIPIIYSGQEQMLSGADDPYDREAIWLQGYSDGPMVQTIRTLNKVRKAAIGASAAYVTDRLKIIYSEERYLVTSKGPVGANIVAVYNNLGEGENKTWSLKGTGFTAGQSVWDVLRCEGGKTVVDEDGTVQANVVGGMPIVLGCEEMLKGTGLCGF